jgi:hypothetical protein
MGFGVQFFASRLTGEAWHFKGESGVSIQLELQFVRRIAVRIS